MERIFGALKRKFVRITQAPEYQLITQAKLVSAACSLWNFVKVHDPADVEACLARSDDQLIHPITIPLVQEYLGHNGSAQEKQRADLRRDRISERMWQDY